MKPLPIGIQDFEELRNGGFLFVDKTEVLHKLMEGKYYFLSRPRRFGKSLTISTLKYIFLGKKELFKGLWIEDKIDWTPYPVIHLSFSSLSTRVAEFEPHLLRKLKEIGSDHGVNVDGGNCKELVNNLVKGLDKRYGKVAILIDEYDKPIIDHITDLPSAEKNRLVMKEFFEGLKDLDPHLKFVFITGVSKFSRMSLFSGLNNLHDITMSKPYSSICGYTYGEMESYFGEALDNLADELGIHQAEFRKEVERWYNGYNWLGEKVYNPWAILNLFQNHKISNYWSSSGNPEFLLKKLHAGMQFNLDNMVVSDVLLNAHNLENMDYRNLLFQTGYLTVHQYDFRTQSYTLGFPNQEVKDTLLQLMYSEFAWKLSGDAKPTCLDLAQAFRDHDLDLAIELIDSMFSSIPHQIFLAKYEAYYHSIVHIMFSLLGLYIECEKPSARGRTDAVVHTNDHIYVFEFKVDATPEKAIEQIRKKGYAEQYRHAGKEIVLLGVEFGKKKKGVIGWKEEVF